MSKSGRILTALLVGAAAGAILGVLFAPDKGKETRKKMSGKLSDLEDDLNNSFKKGKDAVNDFKEKVKNTADELKNNIHSRANDFKS